MRLRVIAFATFVTLLVAGGALLAAAGLSAQEARDLLRKLGGSSLKANQVRIKTVSTGIGGSSAVVEAQIETAVRFKQVKGSWQVADIRLGDRNWESVELVLEAVRREKTRRTDLEMQKVAAALETFRKDEGSYVVTNDIGLLVDRLTPKYLPVPIRFDLWEQQFAYEGKGLEYRLSSAGPDRKHGTDDDLVVTKR